MTVASPQVCGKSLPRFLASHISAKKSVVTAWPSITDGSQLFGVTNGGGSTTRGTVFKCTATPNALDLPANHSPQLWPNPSDGRFTVMPGSEDANLRILNAQGQCIFTSHVPATGLEIDLRDRVKGVYCVQMRIGEQRFTRKVIVQ